MSRSQYGKGWFWCFKRSLIAKPIANARCLSKTLLFETFIAFYAICLLTAAPFLVKVTFDDTKASLLKYFGAIFFYFALSFVLAMVIEIGFLLKRKRFRISRIWNVVVFSFCHSFFTAFTLVIYKETLKKWHTDFVGYEIHISFDGSCLFVLVFAFLLSIATLLENLRVLFTLAQR